jgi:hypothetical protein
MDEAGQGMVLSSPPKCGVPVARIGLIDDARKTRAQCFGVVGPKRDSSGRQDAVRTFLSSASGDCRRQSPPSCDMPLRGETRACALSRRRRGSRLNPLSRTSQFPKAPALVNWTLAFRALLCPRKGLSPPDSFVPTDRQRPFFRFATQTPSHAANSRGNRACRWDPSSSSVCPWNAALTHWRLMPSGGQRRDAKIYCTTAGRSTHSSMREVVLGRLLSKGPA